MSNEDEFSVLIDPLLEKAKKDPDSKESCIIIMFLCDIVKILVGAGPNKHNSDFLLKQIGVIESIFRSKERGFGFRIHPRDKKMMKLLMSESAVYAFDKYPAMNKYYGTEQLEVMDFIAVGWLTKIACAIRPRPLTLVGERTKTDDQLIIGLKNFLLKEIPKAMVICDQQRGGRQTANSFQGMIIDLATAELKPP
jgi:hypothetical protein